MIVMRMLELFSGSRRMSDTFRDAGYATATCDNVHEATFNDVLSLSRRQIIDKLGGDPDVIWASPPCTAFSVASIGRHWTGGWRKYEPKSDTARMGILLLDRTLEIISWFPDATWFIENPRGVMRKMPQLEGKQRYTITFCQYGERRMKPTDIWTNSQKWVPRPMCRNGAECHDRAPRGAKTGTQGLKGAYERGCLPFELCREIVKSEVPIR